MSKSGNIVVRDREGGIVCLFTFFRGEELRQILSAALNRGWPRRMQSEYMARIIFSEMICESLDTISGYGIAAKPYGEDSECLVIDYIKDAVYEAKPEDLDSPISNEIDFETAAFGAE